MTHARSIGYVLLVLSAAIMAGLLLTGSCEASRLYPTAGLAYRYEVEAGERPRTVLLGQGAVALSLGRIAPRLTLRANHRRAELELSAVVRLGGP